jgi:hypothetical protein
MPCKASGFGFRASCVSNSVHSVCLQSYADLLCLWTVHKLHCSTAAQILKTSYLYAVCDGGDDDDDDDDDGVLIVGSGQL